MSAGYSVKVDPGIVRWRGLKLMLYRSHARARQMKKRHSGLVLCCDERRNFSPSPLVKRLAIRQLKF